jgi:hypothetical protein
MFHTFKPILPGCAALALALAVALAATPAAAQLDGVAKAQKARTSNQTPSTTLAPPPAVPGAAPRQDQAIPSDHMTMDMSPNDLLFDAINRGDIGDARDSLARGADLTAHNVLGMTPIDLSVDLGRNDITFLLLSLRGAAPAGSGARTAVAGTTGATRTAKAPPAPAARHPAAVTLVASRTPPAAAAPKPQPLATDPGTPAPQAGFLGFGAAPQQ